MKKTALLLSLLLAPLASAAEIHISLTNPPVEGTVICLLYNNANSFGDLRDEFLTRSFDINPTNQYVMTDVPAGTYALVVFQDENANGFLDKNFIGFPSEPLAISNDYRPKGPPRFQRAQFTLKADSIQNETMTLGRVLGERGTMGVGGGVVGQSSPYRDYDGVVAQPIPVFIYIGERFQVLGPGLQVGLLGSGKTRLAGTLSYRMGAYREEDSAYLQGMGDRRDTAMVGLAVQAELWGGLEAVLGYQHDILDQIGGGNAEFTLGKSFQWGAVGVSPSVGVKWLSAELANYDFGVSSRQARAGRSAYDPGATWNPTVELGSSVELSESWLLIGSLGAEFLDSKIRQSPIVSENYVLQGFFAVSYLF